MTIETDSDIELLNTLSRVLSIFHTLGLHYTTIIHAELVVNGIYKCPYCNQTLIDVRQTLIDVRNNYIQAFNNRGLIDKV